MFTFTDTVPPVEGRTSIDTDRAQEVVDACIDNPNQWARIPIDFLYPELTGSDEKKLVTKSRSLAAQIRKGTAKVFSDYKCEAQSRGPALYIRIVLTARELKELDL